MNDTFTKLHNRVVEISFKHKLSHLSSCLTSLPIIYDIYSARPDPVFILSNGHAGLALYVVLEHFYPHINAEELLDKHGIHPCHDLENKIFCSTGSLGLGLPIAIGYALANPTKQVHCLISDGETFEGSIWESLNFIDNQKIKNIRVHVNMNGFSAYDEVDVSRLREKLIAFLPGIETYMTGSVLRCMPFLWEKGIESHYYILRSEEEKNLLLQ